jgi:hypothetical protein
MLRDHAVCVSPSALEKAISLAATILDNGLAIGEQFIGPVHGFGK